MRFTTAVSILGFVFASTAQAGTQTTWISEQNSAVAAISFDQGPAASGNSAAIILPSIGPANHLAFPPGWAFQLLKTAHKDAPMDAGTFGSLFNAFVLPSAKLENSGGNLPARPAPFSLPGPLQSGYLRYTAANVLNHLVFGPLNGALLNNTRTGFPTNLDTMRGLLPTFRFRFSLP